MKHFVAIEDYSTAELRHMLDVAHRLKKELREKGGNAPILTGQTAALLFEKPSLRTRVSFTVAMNQLGGRAITLTREEIGINTREPARDIARVLSGMCDVIVARTFEHEKVTDLAQYSTVPVINALTDYSHPCQAMSDMLTIEEHFGKLKGLTLAYIGDGNNVARSLAVACGKMGLRFFIATPGSYELPSEDMDHIMTLTPDLDFETTHDPIEAVKTADVIYTDTWTSMGQEAEKAKRIKDFSGFQINKQLLSRAPQTAIVLHCLPAYRELEITDEVIEGKQSKVFPQAENRLHFQKALIAVLKGKA